MVLKSPVINTKLESVRSVVAQYNATFYINSYGGIIYGSGYNSFGGLGNGTTLHSSSVYSNKYHSKVVFIDN